MLTKSLPVAAADIRPVVVDMGEADEADVAAEVADNHDRLVPTVG